MNKRLKKTLLLLLATPMLMANSPAPHVEEETYDDFSYSYVSKTPLDEYYEGNQYYKYNFEVQNLGQGYISYAYIKHQNASSHSSLSSDFGSMLLAPSKSDIFSLVTTSDIDFNSVKPTFECHGYKTFVENAFTSDKKEVRFEEDYYKYYYVDFDSEVPYESGYRYGIIIDFTYDGNDYSIHQEARYYNGYVENSILLYYGELELDVSKLTINKLLMTKSLYHSYYSGVADVIKGILILLAVCFGVILSGGIFCIIFFSIRKARRRKKLATN